MRRAVFLAAGFVAALVGNALAQSAVPVHAGQRVRVRSTEPQFQEVVGVLEAARSDSVVVQAGGGSSATAIPRSSITQFEVSQGRHSKWLIGMLVGAGVGAATGAALGAASHNQSDWLFSTGDNAVLGAIVLTPVGALAGAVIGLMIKSERWETVPLDQLSLRLIPGPHEQVGVGLTLAF